MTTSGIPASLIGAVTAMQLPHWQTLPFVMVNFLALLVITDVPAISMALIGAAR